MRLRGLEQPAPCGRKTQRTSEDMLTLGLCGGLDPIYDNRYDSSQYFTYDAAAVLVEDGQVVAALEEERLTRIRRTNKFPFLALQACLRQRGVSLGDVDRIAYYAAEDQCNLLLGRLRLVHPDLDRFADARSLLRAAIGRELGCDVDPARLVFVPHKLTHAVSAIATAGFPEALVMILDSEGGVFAGARQDGRNVLEPLAAFPATSSLGDLCHRLISLLGYGPFDEAEAVELAAYGDPSRYREVLSTIYSLRPEGGYELHLEQVGSLLGVVPVRKKGEPLQQSHKDLMAAFQVALEDIVLHVLEHHRARSGLRRLCLAGGGAQNCALNSRILTSGLFDEVFVQPAAHDAGCALGAALYAACEEAAPATPPVRLSQVFWGTDIGDASRVAAELETWGQFVSYEEPSELSRRVAELLAGGALIAWAQGRSEFGQRTLGHRSLFADPRAKACRERVGQMKGRAPHRPLAVAVLEEDVGELFELPCEPEALRFKSFALQVRAEQREALAAALHEDGSGRPQAVSRTTNPALWDLLRCFKELTGVGALLNSSFDNEAEPMVESIEDAVASCLSMGLDALVVGDALVRRREISWREKLTLVPVLPRYTRVCRTYGFVTSARLGMLWEIRTTYDDRLKHPISEELYELLMAADGERTAAELLGGRAEHEAVGRRLAEELWALWTQRFVALRPAPASTRRQTF